MGNSKMSSDELNKVFEKAINNIDETKSSLTSIKEDLDKKLLITKHENDYINWRLQNIENGYVKQNTMLLLCNYPGSYDQYGNIVYPKTLSKPINLFNLNAHNDKVYFRPDAQLKVNSMSSESYTSVLKSDSIKTDIFFEEFKSPTITLEVSMDTSNVLGTTNMNVIEIDPYLPGSFDIDSIILYYYDENSIMSKNIISSVSAVGKERIVLDKKYKFVKVIFNITVNYISTNNDNVVYPFGLKHLYFYDSDFNSSSEVIVPITSKSTITRISNDIIIKDVFGSKATTILEQGIKIYSDKELTQEVEPSYPNLINPITKITSTLYAKIPVSLPIVAIQFFVFNN